MPTVVIAQYRAKPGAENEVARLLSTHVEPTRAEPGCLQFLVNRSVDDPRRFVLYEQYIDEDAFQAHRRTQHFKRLIEEGVVPLLEERLWTRYQLIEAR